MLLFPLFLLLIPVDLFFGIWEEMCVDEDNRGGGYPTATQGLSLETFECGAYPSRPIKF